MSPSAPPLPTTRTTSPVSAAARASPTLLKGLTWDVIMTRRSAFLLGTGLLVVLTLAAYVPTAKCGYVWDDFLRVHDNPMLRSLEGLRHIWFRIDAARYQYYPMTQTTYWLEYHLWELDPTGYHVVNVLLHAVNAVLLWRLLTVLQVPGAWVAAAVFALHPVQVESVAWITQRKNVLSGLFYFGAALAYLRYARVSGNGSGGERSVSFYALSLVLFLCALVSKTVTCTLPAVLLLLLWWKRPRVGWREFGPLVPHFVIGIAFGLLTAGLETDPHRVGAVGKAWDYSPVDRCLIAGRASCF